MKRNAFLILLFLSLAAWGDAPKGKENISPAYHLYIGFTATEKCVPEDGPYLTKLSLDAAFRDLRFGFGSKKAGSEPMSWWLAAGPASTRPVFVVFGEGKITAHELCAHAECDDEIVKAWFTKENTSFSAELAVVPEGDAADRDDIVNDEDEGDSEDVVNEEDEGDSEDVVNDEADEELEEAVEPRVRCVFECKLPLEETLAWSDDCAVRHEQSTPQGMEFSFALPVEDLLQGKPLTLEFPFSHDDFDEPGTLTVRFVPVKQK
jgi:hypothetical protein